jgi:uncharacterized protein (TIGR03083 family)
VLIDEYLEALRVHGEGLADAAERTGLSAEVPTCPQWQVSDLLGHLGAVHRWACANLLAPPRSRPMPMPDPPAEDLIAWYRASHRELLNVLAQAPDDLDCWTFLAGATSPKAFWARRQAQETAMHRVDAEGSDGSRLAFAAPFAIDGIDELLFGFLARSRSKLLADPARSLLIQPSDAQVWWHITVCPDRREVRTSGDQSADCVVSATASDLYLLLWNRPPAAPPEVGGDAAVLAMWRELAVI